MQADPRPCSVSHLAEAKRKVDQDLIDILERALADARSGDLLGIVMFGTHIGGFSGCGQAGENDVPTVIMAFEDWKFRRVWERNRTDEP